MKITIKEENSMMNFEVYPIGRIQNNENGTVIEIAPKYIPAMKALEGFSHINVIWWFSDSDNNDARNTLDAQNRIKMPLTQWAFSPQGRLSALIRLP